MSNYDNTNRGILGKNDRKSSDKHPDISGSINVEGVEYFIDGWHKKRNDGTGSFYSLSVKKKEKQPGSGVDNRSNAGGYGSASGGQTANRDLEEDGDAIPF